MKRNQWTAALFAVLLFCCGLAAGALGHRYFTGNVVSAKTAEDFREHYMSEMKSRLKLDEKQVAELETILDETKAKYKAVREQSRPAMLKIKQDQTSRVKAILTAQQVPLYEQLVAEHERHFKEAEEHDRKRDQERGAGRHAQAGQ